jgi:tagatose-6-phosphate ketose/aldose isomerase
LDDSSVALAYLVFAQYLALFTSLEYGKTPDNPFPAGEVSRVVRGVTIYPMGR